MQRKINVFIGSSEEGLNTAEILKNGLELGNEIECKVWNDDPEYNKSTLTLLTHASYVYDFGIFIACHDDNLVSRKKRKAITRDNVIFEYGLFQGSMGNNRTFLIQEEGVSLPSDLDSYNTPRFKKDFQQEDWRFFSARLKEEIKQLFKKNEIQSLPSTSLAIGYYHSFIEKVASFIDSYKHLPVLKNHDKVFSNFQIQITIPNELSKDTNAKATRYFDIAGYNTGVINFPKRHYGVRYSIDSDTLIIGDLPTTLNALKQSIDLLIQDSGLGENETRRLVERKELENFKHTLDYLISQNDNAKNLAITFWEKR